MNWVVGDVHGMLGPLRVLLDAVHADDPAAKLVFAGDYVNRGGESKGVIDLLLTLDTARFVRGNHDDIFDLILHGDCFSEKSAGGTPAAAFKWFMDYGLDRTLMSYGLEDEWLRQTMVTPTLDRMDQLCEAVPFEHRMFIRTLGPAVDDETFFVVHGYWPPKQAWVMPGENTLRHADLRQAMLWSRFSLAEIDAEKPWKKRGFFGHTPIHTYFPDGKNAPMVPIVGKNAALLDTACAIVTWGRMTAYCVEESRYLQVNHYGEMVKE